MSKVTLICADALKALATLPDESVQCVVTSPPYWGLRDYGIEPKIWGGEAGCQHEWGSNLQPRGKSGWHTFEHKYHSPGCHKTTLGSTMKDKPEESGGHGSFCRLCGAWRGSLGLEPTIELFVEHMVEIFREVRRVLRSDGVLFLNLGDSYMAHVGHQNPQTKDHKGSGFCGPNRTPQSGLKPKDLCGIPWRVALALQQPYYTGKINDEKDRVWLASMIDGEGCMYIHKRKVGQNNGQGYARKSDSYGAGLEVANTHREIVDRCLKITGMGSICCVHRETKTKNRNIPLYRWNMRSNQCREIIREIYPYLVGKQHEARLLLGCPSSGPDAEKAHESLMALHNGKEATIDFPAPKSMYEPGWYLRSDVIWSKANPMPESCTDRPTKAHEYVFLLTKSAKYYWDQEAVRQPHKRLWDENNGGSISTGRMVQCGGAMGDMSSHPKGYPLPKLGGANIKTVWEIATAPFPQAHFATYPPELVRRCVAAGSKEDDMVLDPFSGAGTTALVAAKLGRDAIGIELNPAYVEMSRRRILGEMGMLAEMEVINADVP